MDGVTVLKVSINKSDEPYHIITQWGDDLKIKLVSGEKYWNGTFYMSDIHFFCKHLDITEEKYHISLKEALTNNFQDSKFKYDFDKSKLKWKIDNGHVSIVYGICELKEYFSEGGNQQIIETLMKLNENKDDKLRNQENETMELGRQLRHFMNKFEELSELKNQMENDLYIKTLELLNTKKKKYADLQEFISIYADRNTGESSKSESVKIKNLDSRNPRELHRISDSDTDD